MRTAKILGTCISDRKGIPKTNVGKINLIYDSVDLFRKGYLIY